MTREVGERHLSLSSPEWARLLCCGDVMTPLPLLLWVSGSLRVPRYSGTCCMLPARAPRLAENLLLLVSHGSTLCRWQHGIYARCKAG